MATAWTALASSKTELVTSSVTKDPPCTLNWGYRVPNSGYLGPTSRKEEGLGQLYSFPPHTNAAVLIPDE